MQPTMMEMLVEERQRELQRKRHDGHHKRDFQISGKGRRVLDRLFKSVR